MNPFTFVIQPQTLLIAASRCSNKLPASPLFGAYRNHSAPIFHDFDERLLRINSQLVSNLAISLFCLHYAAFGR